MSFSVGVKISRRLVSFWYQTDNQRFQPLSIKGTQVVPLYFYIDQNQFYFGRHARDRFFNNDPNAYGDYFDIIQDPSKHFNFHNSPRRVKQLLYYGIEQYLSHFLTSVLYKSDSIESYRSSFPLKLIFDRDLSSPECKLVEDLFVEAGYRTLSVMHYQDLILEQLRTGDDRLADQAILMLTALDDTLFIDFYLKGAFTTASAMVFAKQGADPRVRLLGSMIVEYIQNQHSYLQLDVEREVSALLPYCKLLLTGNHVMIAEEAELTNGSRFWFRINAKNLEDRVQYYQGSQLVSNSLHDVIRNAGVLKDQVVVVLCSEQIQTPYFTKRLLQGFPQVKFLEASHTEETLQLAFNKPIYTKENQAAKNTQPLATISSNKAPRLPPLPSRRNVQPAMPPEKALSEFNQETVPKEDKTVFVPPLQASKPPLPIPKPVGNDRPRLVPPPPLLPKKKN